MAINTTMFSQVIFNATIADTVAHASTNVLMDYMVQTTLIVASTLNQALTLSTNYSDDGGNTWTPIGNTYALAAGGSLVTNQFVNDLTGIRVFVGQIQIVATAAVAPTSGNLKITIQGMGDS